MNPASINSALKADARKAFFDRMHPHVSKNNNLAVGEKHLGDQLSVKPKVLYPNASPSVFRYLAVGEKHLGDQLSVKPKVLYPNASVTPRSANALQRFLLTLRIDTAGI